MDSERASCHVFRGGIPFPYFSDGFDGRSRRTLEDSLRLHAGNGYFKLAPLSCHARGRNAAAHGESPQGRRKRGCGERQ